MRSLFRNRRRSVVGVVVCLLLMGCGGSQSDSATRSSETDATAELPRVQLSVWNEDSRTVRREVFKVQGTATPGALVDVDGDTTTAASNGRWFVNVLLSRGSNSISIEATANDRQPASAELTVTRRSSAAELAASRAERKAAAEKRAQQKAAAEAKNAAKVGQTDYENPSFTKINSMMTDYLSAVINDPSTADPSLAAADFEDAAASASPGCAKELRATATALGDTSGGPEEIRARVLDAAAGAFTECA